MSTPPSAVANTKLVISSSPRTPKSPRLARSPNKSPEILPTTPPSQRGSESPEGHHVGQSSQDHPQPGPGSSASDPQVRDAFEGDVDEGIGDGESMNSSSYSLTDSILEYRNLHGRTFQSSKTTEYWGPNDDHQNDGLDIAHHFITMLLGDKLYEAPIEDPTSILDVGTGTGIWAIDMADQFPGAEVTGFDISPIQPTWVPPNCKFHIDDAQLDWTYRDNEFDFVHIRALYGSISDWPALYRQAFRTLKPGGYLENFEFTITLRSDEPSVKDDPEHIFQQWANVFFEATERLGKTIKIGMDGRMKRYMEAAGFVDVVVTDHKLPCGGWSEDPKLREIGQYNLAFMEQSLEGFALFLLKEIMGWEYIEVQVFLARMRKAIRDMKLKPYYIVPNVYARKPLAA